MEISMPELDWLEATRRIPAETATEHPRAVLMLATLDLNEYVHEALHTDASGLLLNDLLPEQLIAAAITQRPIEQSAHEAPPSTPPPQPERLTRREVEVLILVARGLSNAEIATELVLSQATVKTHIKHVLSKLDVRDRVQAVVLAYEAGLVIPGRAAAKPLRAATKAGPGGRTPTGSDSSG